MSYDIHIHRRDKWLDQGNDITLDEWKALIARDPSLVQDSNAPAAIWTAPDGGEGDFYWDNGEISVRSPTEAVAAKAYEIAHMLSARVQGDDLEFYGPNGSVLP